jgi:hypothetical protein
MELALDSFNQACPFAIRNQMILEFSAMKPRLPFTVGFRFSPWKDVPMDVRFGVPVAGVVHLPGPQCVKDCPAGQHDFLKQRLLKVLGKIVKLPNVLLKQNERITFKILMISQDKVGMLELMD